ncbi:MAG: NTP transferase domain-containing protein [Opitutales bacterium]
MSDAACALLLLADGGSTRMGRPKQLLPVGGQPLLRRLAEVALGTPVSPVIVVLGAHAEMIRPCLQDLAVQVVVNTGWPEGLGSSIRTGIEALDRIAPASPAVILTLADQPDLSPTHLGRLLAAWQASGRGMAASEFRGVLMPPVCFGRKYFAALRQLPGDTGARSLLQAHAHDVTTVPMIRHADLDTPGDYAAYRAATGP